MQIPIYVHIDRPWLCIVTGCEACGYAQRAESLAHLRARIETPPSLPQTYRVHLSASARLWRLRQRTPPPHRTHRQVTCNQFPSLHQHWLTTTTTTTTHRGLLARTPKTSTLARSRHAQQVTGTARAGPKVGVSMDVLTSVFGTPFGQLHLFLGPSGLRRRRRGRGGRRGWRGSGRRRREQLQNILVHGDAHPRLSEGPKTRSLVKMSTHTKSHPYKPPQLLECRRQ